MTNSMIRNWLKPFSRFLLTGRRRHKASSKSRRKGLGLERLEDRTIPSVTIAATNNNGQGYAALSFNQSGGYTPPDTNGAAGPSNYVETVNQTVAIFSPKVYHGAPGPCRRRLQPL
jgi:hypothetical protein